MHGWLPWHRSSLTLFWHVRVCVCWVMHRATAGGGSCAGRAVDAPGKPHALIDYHIPSLFQSPPTHTPSPHTTRPRATPRTWRPSPPSTPVGGTPRPPSPPSTGGSTRQQERGRCCRWTHGSKCCRSVCRFTWGACGLLNARGTMWAAGCPDTEKGKEEARIMRGWMP